MKRVLFHVEPFVMHNRPFHYWAWLEVAATLARELTATGEWDARFALNGALATRAVAPHDPARAHDPANGQGLPRESLAIFSQEELRAPYGAPGGSPFGVPNVAILDGLQHGTWPAAVLEAHAVLLRERLRGFQPDVIVTWTPSAALRVAFPDALVLHTENGIFSRAPYPRLLFFDPLGLYEESVLATAAHELLARMPSAEERAFLARWREALARQHRASTPFAELERAMRTRYERLVLLPLQFGGEPGFDLNGPFRNQGEYLLHVLERVPEDVGVIVTEHPTAHWLGDRIDEETQEWVRLACPQAVVVPLSVSHTAGQSLVPHVDAVVSVSSSIGLQALFWGRELICPGVGHLARWSHTGDVARTGRAAREVTAPDGALAWLMRHYFVRDGLCLRDAAWTRGFFDRRLARWRAGVRGLALCEPHEPLAEFERAVLETAGSVTAAAPAPLDALRNGGFDDVDDHGAPLHWEMVAGQGSRVRLTRVAVPAMGARAARIEREARGQGPTLLLQRIDDARRLSGASVTVTFAARGPEGAPLLCYLYQQRGEGGGASGGTHAQPFRLGAEWARLRYTATVPAVEESALGASHHTELVLMLPADAAPGAVEIADVRLGPAEWLPEAA